jgi:glutamyl-Q tRNA(Asp) synthetase
MYIGRFAPSPTGALHAGSLVAALASYLDARVNHGRWLIRIEDIDEARTVASAAEDIIQTLAAFGMRSDGEILWQSTRKIRYSDAFDKLGSAVYACACSRKEIADSRVTLAADGAVIYPGTCRNGLAPGRTPRAWRVRVPAATDPHALIQFDDRWQGLISENLAEHVGDFVLKRADGFWAYQLAVVVDDAEQGVTDIVRGADLLDSTVRQIYLQRLLGFSTPRYLHVPAVMNDRREKLSKQTGAQPLDVRNPINALMEASEHLGLTLSHTPSAVDEFWTMAIPAWGQRFVRT